MSINLEPVTLLNLTPLLIVNDGTSHLATVFLIMAEACLHYIFLLVMLIKSAIMYQQELLDTMGNLSLNAQHF